MPGHTFQEKGTKKNSVYKSFSATGGKRHWNHGRRGMAHVGVVLLAIGPSSSAAQSKSGSTVASLHAGWRQNVIEAIPEWYTNKTGRLRHSFFMQAPTETGWNHFRGMSE